jgi:dTDP-4-dehydrorhamnose reductase
MRYLILGASGMVGHAIAIYLKEKGHKVTGFSLIPFPYIENIVGDAREPAEIQKVVEKTKYDVIVNCMGILNQDADRKKADTIIINSYIPHFLVERTKNMNIQIVQISTDCVFSGERGGYREKDFKDGKSFYDRSKALGEIINERDITFRQSLVGPDPNAEGIGLLNWFMRQKNEIQGYRNVFWNSISNLQLARAIEAVSRKNVSGIYHLVRNESVSKYDLITLFNKYLRKEPIRIRAVDEPKMNKTLINSRTDFEFIVDDYDTQIIEISAWIKRHPDLYPHYRY